MADENKLKETQSEAASALGIESGELAAQPHLVSAKKPYEPPRLEFVGEVSRTTMFTSAPIA